MPNELPSVVDAIKLFVGISGLSSRVLGIFVGRFGKKKQDENKKCVFFSSQHGQNYTKPSAICSV
jgi:hypothetical protein